MFVGIKPGLSMIAAAKLQTAIEKGKLVSIAISDLIKLYLILKEGMTLLPLLRIRMVNNRR